MIGQLLNTAIRFFYDLNFVINVLGNLFVWAVIALFGYAFAAAFWQRITKGRAQRHDLPPRTNPR